MSLALVFASMYARVSFTPSRTGPLKGCISLKASLSALSAAGSAA